MLYLILLIMLTVIETCTAKGAEVVSNKTKRWNDVGPDIHDLHQKMNEAGVPRSIWPMIDRVVESPPNDAEFDVQFRRTPIHNVAPRRFAIQQPYRQRPRFRQRSRPRQRRPRPFRQLLPPPPPIAPTMYEDDEPENDYDEYYDNHIEEAEPDPEPYYDMPRHKITKLTSQIPSLRRPLRRRRPNLPRQRVRTRTPRTPMTRIPLDEDIQGGPIPVRLQRPERLGRPSRPSRPYHQSYVDYDYDDGHDPADYNDYGHYDYGGDDEEDNRNAASNRAVNHAMDSFRQMLLSLVNKIKYNPSTRALPVKNAPIKGKDPHKYELSQVDYHFRNVFSKQHRHVQRYGLQMLNYNQANDNKRNRKNGAGVPPRDRKQVPLIQRALVPGSQQLIPGAVHQNMLHEVTSNTMQYLHATDTWKHPHIAVPNTPLGRQFMTSVFVYQDFTHSPNVNFCNACQYVLNWMRNFVINNDIMRKWQDQIAYQVCRFLPDNAVECVSHVQVIAKQVQGKIQHYLQTKMCQNFGCPKVIEPWRDQRSTPHEKNRDCVLCMSTTRLLNDGVASDNHLNQFIASFGVLNNPAGAFTAVRDSVRNLNVASFCEGTLGFSCHASGPLLQSIDTVNQPPPAPSNVYLPQFPSFRTVSGVAPPNNVHVSMLNMPEQGLAGGGHRTVIQQSVQHHPSVPVSRVSTAVHSHPIHPGAAPLPLMGPHVPWQVPLNSYNPLPTVISPPGLQPTEQFFTLTMPNGQPYQCRTCRIVNTFAQTSYPMQPVVNPLIPRVTSLANGVCHNYGVQAGWANSQQTQCSQHVVPVVNQWVKRSLDEIIKHKHKDRRVRRQIACQALCVATPPQATAVHASMTDYKLKRMANFELGKTLNITHKTTKT